MKYYKSPLLVCSNPSLLDEHEHEHEDEDKPFTIHRSPAFVRQLPDYGAAGHSLRTRPRVCACNWELSTGNGYDCSGGREKCRK